mmetsp:Transcript_23946/g.26581  ORF Transcript_23946/g.26581 Transcript_23946/m.26581 type:complete len:132 (+) Transcript_23946:2-397(+)
MNRGFRQREKIDREKSCPLLLRVFTKLGEHHRADEFAGKGKEPVDDEVQIYTWKDASLAELTDLLKTAKRAARQPGARLSFAFVYPDKTGRNVVRQVGETYSNRRSKDDRLTLGSLKFETGDFLDVAIHIK